MPAILNDADATVITAGHFVHDWPHSRVRFGVGEHQRISEEADALGIQRSLIISDSGTRPLADDVAALCSERVVGRINDAIPHVSSAVAANAADQARGLGAHGVICVGGGSATGLAKGVARLTGLPILAVPTTYAGSEMTSIWGLTDAGRKTTGRDDTVRPRVVIYDPALTLSLPAAVTVTSGMNAVAHCVEALYSDGASPITMLVASTAISELLGALPVLVDNPSDIPARSRALYGAWLAGWSLNVASMGLHHKLCHILGGTFDLPHAALHTVILPHVVAFNAPAALAAVDAIRAALHHVGFGTDTARVAEALWEYIKHLGGPVGLAEIGLSQTDFPRVVAAVLNQISPARPLQPRDPTDAQLTELVAHALAGQPPSRT